MILKTFNMEFDNYDDRATYLKLKYNVIKDVLNQLTDGDNDDILRAFYRSLINELEFRLEILKHKHTAN